MNSNALDRAVSAILFTFFALMLSVPHSAELAFAALSLTGVVIMLKDKFSKFAIADFKIYTLLVWWFFLVIGFTIINTENVDMGIQKLGTNIHYFFAPFAAVLFYKVNLKNVIPNAIKLGVIIASIFAAYQHHVLDIDRIYGASHPVIFGGLLAIMIFVAISNFPKEAVAEKILSILSFAFGVYAVFLSGTRGAWLLILLLPFLLLLTWAKQQLITKKTLLIILVAAGVLFFSFSFNDKVVKRINMAINEFSVSVTKDSTSSVGTRLTMWRHGFEVFKQKPYLGHGLQNTTNVVAERIRNENNELQGLRLERVVNHFKRFDHLHNEYINTAVAKGILGLTTLLILLLLPLTMFWKRVTAGDSSKAHFATIGIITIVGYIIIGMTNIMSTQPLLNMFFLIILAVSFIGSSVNKSV